MTRLVCAWVLVNGVLLAPTWISAALTGEPTTPWISVEAALVAGGMALLPRRPWSRGLAWTVAAAVVLIATVAFVDLVFRVSLGRSLDLSLDLYLMDAVRRLAVGNMGVLRSVVLLGFGGVVAAALVFLTGWLLSPTSRREEEDEASLVPWAAGGIAGGALALALFGLFLGAVGARVRAPAVTLIGDQLEHFRETAAERAVFAADLEDQPRRFADMPDLLSRLEGRHVVLAYLESYGMAALDDPELASVVEPRLRAAAARVAAAGVAMATGRFTSPTVGGQSWYAHGTMLSGLWLENQLRYELLLASDRETLLDDFRRVGYRTATVMPAITTPWPEALAMGFDDVYTSRSIPYEGPPFYWVTMPDQFTWSFVGDLVRKASSPLFVEVGMVSSHAPWTPVLPLLDWDRMGDGSVFEPYRRDGYPPEEIWWDVEVLRDGYARSTAYSLDAMAGFARHLLDDRTLLIVSGDHQAAPWVTGAGGADVPVHVFAREPALVEPFVDWGFELGALPGPPASAHRMDEFREWLLEAFSGAG